MRGRTLDLNAPCEELDRGADVWRCRAKVGGFVGHSGK